MNRLRGRPGQFIVCLCAVAEVEGEEVGIDVVRMNLCSSGDQILRIADTWGTREMGEIVSGGLPELYKRKDVRP